MQKLTISEKLGYSTIRIECLYPNGSTGFGTGFFYNFCGNIQKDMSIPVIITNKHVVQGAIKCRLVFVKKNKDGSPNDLEHHEVVIDNFAVTWLGHSEEEVDLCAIPIGGLLNHYLGQGVELFFIPIREENLPTPEIIEEFSSMEEVVMVGYPTGIWDKVNNKPILRKGITATHPRLDYCGRKEFLIDAACFPGSSGSPVLIVNEGHFQKRGGDLMLGERFVLLGVLYAGPQFSAMGEIVVVDVPTIQKPIASSMIPINLGFIIKAVRISELEQQYIKVANIK